MRWLAWLAAVTEAIKGLKSRKIQQELFNQPVLPLGGSSGEGLIFNPDDQQHVLNH
jgi:hypothetical protein